VRSDELQNFGVGRRSPLPRFFVSVDSGEFEVSGINSCGSGDFEWVAGGQFL
jgi:hypothetical protein